MACLDRVHATNGVVWIRSPILAAAGVVHGFSTRHGGVSEAPFDTLNLAGERSTGGADATAALRENRRRFVEAIGAGGSSVATVNQVHGADIVDADSCVGNPAASHEADAIVAGAGARAACMVRVADCVPVLIADLSGGVVAAIHAGWRGVVAGVVPATIAHMRRRGGGATARLVAAIGPCAGTDAFEVGEEVAEAFAAANLDGSIRRRADWPRPHVDLFAAVRRQLIDVGVDASAVDGEPTCTITRADDFFSHRRDAGRSGRMAALIVGQ